MARLDAVSRQTQRTDQACRSCSREWYGLILGVLRVAVTPVTCIILPLNVNRWRALYCTHASFLAFLGLSVLLVWWNFAALRLPDSDVSRTSLARRISPSLSCPDWPRLPRADRVFMPAPQITVVNCCKHNHVGRAVMACCRDFRTFDLSNASFQWSIRARQSRRR